MHISHLSARHYFFPIEQMGKFVWFKNQHNCSSFIVPHFCLCKARALVLILCYPNSSQPYPSKNNKKNHPDTAMGLTDRS